MGCACRLGELFPTAARRNRGCRAALEEVAPTSLSFFQGEGEMNDYSATEATDDSLFDLSPGAFLQRLAYLLTTLPLGIFYFVFLSVGISLGLGLAILWVGILILALVMVAWLAMAEFERHLAGSLLGLEIPKPPRPRLAQAGLWETAKMRLADSSTWKSLLFLVLKLPLGIASFTLTFSAAVTALALLAVPFVFEIVPIQIAFNYVTTWDEALLCALAGVVMAGVTVALVNGQAWLWRQAASALLSPSEPMAAASPEAGETPLVIQ